MQATITGLRDDIKGCRDTLDPLDVTDGVLYDDGVMVRNSSGIAGLAPHGAAYLHPRDASMLAVVDGDEVIVHADDAFLCLGEKVSGDVYTRGDRQHPFWAKVEWPKQR